MFLLEMSERGNILLQKEHFAKIFKYLAGYISKNNFVKK